MKTVKAKTYENFKVIEAEIVGTEKYDIDTRIELHKELLEYLENGDSIEIALTKLEPKLKYLEELHKMGEFAQWLKRHRG